MKIEVSISKQIQSYYDSETRVLHTLYSGMFNEENALHHFHKVEEFVAKNPLLGLIADVRKLNGSYNKVMQYFKTEGYPKIKKSGLIAEAFIIGDDIMVNYLTDKLISVVRKHEIKCKSFKSYEAANTWLLEKINTK